MVYIINIYKNQQIVLNIIISIPFATFFCKSNPPKTGTPQAEMNNMAGKQNTKIDYFNMKFIK